MGKIKQRLLWIGGNAIQQGLAPLGQFFISFFVVFFASKSIWGELVSYLLVINLATMFFNWGQNTYLLRSFSQKPQQIALLWQDSIQTRKILLLPLILFFLVEYNDNNLIFYLLLWLLSTFVFRSYDPIHLYVRKFKVPILIDSFSIVIITIFLGLFRYEITAAFIVKLYAFQALIKAIFYSFLYQKLLWKEKKGHFKFSFLRSAFPFFIPAMIGFVQSRIDLYGVAYYLSEKELGAYQIFFKVLSLFILASRIILSPFLKNIYRMPRKALERLERLVLLGAILLIPPLLGLIYWLFPLVYGIDFAWPMYLAAYLMLVPFFAYVIKTHQLIKYHQEKKMVLVFLGAAGCNLCSNFVLIPTYGALGAIVSTAIVQWVLWAVFAKILRAVS